MALLNTFQAARELGVTASYVRDLIRARKLRARRLGERGEYRIEENEVLRYMGVVPVENDRERAKSRMERAVARARAEGRI